MPIRAGEKSESDRLPYAPSYHSDRAFLVSQILSLHSIAAALECRLTAYGFCTGDSCTSRLKYSNTSTSLTRKRDRMQRYVAVSTVRTIFQINNVAYVP